MTWYTGLSIEVSEAKSLEPGILLQASSLNPYCGVTVDNTKICRTATKFHTSTPLWTEEFYFHCPQKGFHYVTFTVTHDDTIKSRKLGRLMLSWEQIGSAPINGWYPLYEVKKSDEVQGEIYLAVAKFAGKLRVLVSEAKDLAAKDVGGSADPYCQLTFNGVTFKTKKLDRTRFPVWMEALDFPLDANQSDVSSSLILTVLDKDLIDDDFMGEVIIPFSEISNMDTAVGQWYSLLPRTRDRAGQESLGSLRIKVSLIREYLMGGEVYSPLREVMTSAVNDKFSQLFDLFSKNSVIPLANKARNLMTFYLSADLVLPYLYCVCNAELSVLKDPNTLFRANSLTSKSLDHLLKLTSIPYLKDTLQYTIQRLIQEDKNCEIDPTKLSSAPESKRISLAVLFESPSTSADEQLSTYLMTTMATILSSESRCPMLIRRALKQLFIMSADHFPDQEDLPFLAVSGFLFLRFFAAAILTPKLFCLSENYPNERASRSLTLLAKLVQSVANLTTAKEDYMRAFDDVIMEMHGRLKEFIKRLIDVPDQAVTDNRTKLLHKQMSFDGYILISGILQKCKLSNIKFLGAIHTGINIKRRYFELTSHMLSYYTDSVSRTLKGSIHISDVTHVEQMDPEALGFKYTLQLRIQSPDEKEPKYFFMIATSLNDMRAWHSTLTKCCLYNKNQTALFHPGFFKRSSWSCCRNKEKSFLGCKATRQGVILGDWQDPLEQNFELQTIYSQLNSIHDKLPKLLQNGSKIPSTMPPDGETTTDPENPPTIPFPPLPLNEPCLNLLKALDSISTAREECRKFC